MGRQTDRRAHRPILLNRDCPSFCLSEMKKTKNDKKC